MTKREFVESYVLARAAHKDPVGQQHLVTEAIQVWDNMEALVLDDFSDIPDLKVELSKKAMPACLDLIWTAFPEHKL